MFMKIPHFHVLNDFVDLCFSQIIVCCVKFVMVAKNIIAM